MAHALDFDDVSYTFCGHPSAPILPATLAAGQYANTSGLSTLEAFVIGFEIACKVGKMFVPEICEKGWHSTGIIASFGATAAVGRLLNLNDVQMTSALAINASLTSGVKGNTGSTSKHIQAGRAAENGIVAAMLGKGGFTGVKSVFEGVDGLFQVLNVNIKNRDIDTVINVLGNPFDIVSPGFYIKQYPCCSETHSAIYALKNILDEYQITPEEIDSIDCYATPMVNNCLTYPFPKSGMEAQFSMQFCLSLLLLQNNLTLTDFSDEKVKNPKVIDLMKKINLRIGEEFLGQGYAPSEHPSAVIVKMRMKNGNQCVKRADRPEWNPNNYPSKESLEKKYYNCADGVLTKNSIDKSIEIINSLEQIKDINKLMNLL